MHSLNTWTKISGTYLFSKTEKKTFSALFVMLVVLHTSQAMQNLRHSSNPGSNEPQVSTSDACDADTSEQTADELPFGAKQQL